MHKLIQFTIVISLWFSTTSLVSAEISIQQVIPDSAIYNFQIDRDGTLLWISHLDSQLYTYDGIDMVHYPQHNSLLASTIDPDGQIWFIGVSNHSFSYSLYYWDGMQLLEAYTLPEEYLDMDARGIAVSNDTYLVLTEQGVIYWDGTMFTTYTMAEEISLVSPICTAIDSTGSFWVGTSEGLASFDGVSWTTYTTDDGLLGDVINALYVDKIGNVWVGNREWGYAGLACFDGDSWVTYSRILYIEDFSTYISIKSITQDEHGTIWFGHGYGIGRLVDSELSDLRTDEGIEFPVTSVDVIASDRDGSLWVRNSNSELYRITLDSTPVEISKQYQETIVLTCYPNPFNPTTTIGYSLPNKSSVELSVYNTSGQLIQNLSFGMQEPGSHEYRFDGSGLPSGVYFYRVEAGRITQSGRMLLMK